jgi:hypothetical protein
MRAGAQARPQAGVECPEPCPGRAVRAVAVVAERVVARARLQVGVGCPGPFLAFVVKVGMTAVGFRSLIRDTVVRAVRAMLTSGAGCRVLISPDLDAVVRAVTETTGWVGHPGHLLFSVDPVADLVAAAVLQQADPTAAQTLIAL